MFRALLDGSCERAQRTGRSEAWKTSCGVAVFSLSSYGASVCQVPQDKMTWYEIKPATLGKACAGKATAMKKVDQSKTKQKLLRGIGV